MLSAISALAVKNLRVTARSPLFAIISIVVPVAFTMLYAIVIHVSTTGPVAVAVDDQSPQAQAFVQTMRELRNDDGSYYEIRATGPDHARAMYADGRVGALVTIPQGFGAAVAAGRPAEVNVQLVNINADGTKNQHLRIEAAVRAFETAHGTNPNGKLVLHETTVLDHDIPITIYLGTALMVLAALYAGMVGAGTTVAREFEDRTAKALVMSPAGPRAIVAGTWASIVIVSLATVGAGVLGVGWVLGYPLGHLGLLSVAALVTAWSYGSALGVFLGTLLRRSLPLVPIAVIISVAHFLLCGYDSYLRGFAHGGLIEPLWRTTTWIPLSGVIDAFRFEVSGLTQQPGTPSSFLWTSLAAAVLATASALVLTRRLRFAQGQ